MTRNVKFLEKENWSLIKRGWIFEAAVPYVGERPLEFFIPDRNEKFRGKKVPTAGTSVSLSTTFETSEEYQVVLGLKQRKVVVISSDELNSDEDHNDVIIAKIYSIKDYEKSEPWYQPTIDGTHPMFVYLPPSVTGKECYVDLSNTTTVHKNMLLDEKQDISKYMQIIEDRIDYCHEMGIYKKNQSIANEDVS